MGHEGGIAAPIPGPPATGETPMITSLKTVLRIALTSMTLLSGGMPAMAAVDLPGLHAAPTDVARACHDRSGRIIPCRRISLT